MTEKRTIGRYEVLERIGRGMQGTVFLARDPALDRSVAVEPASTSQHRLDFRRRQRARDSLPRLRIRARPDVASVARRAWQAPARARLRLCAADSRCRRARARRGRHSPRLEPAQRAARRPRQPARHGLRALAIRPQSARERRRRPWLAALHGARALHAGAARHVYGRLRARRHALSARLRHVEIKALVDAEREDKTAASQRVLGVSSADIGVEVAKIWHLPESIIAAIRPPKAGDDENPYAALSLRAAFANELCAVVSLRAEEPQDAALARLLDRYAAPLELTRDYVVKLLAAGLEKLEQNAPILELDCGSSPFCKAARSWLARLDPAGAEEAGDASARAAS